MKTQDEMIALAIEAYRAAIAYRDRIDRQWVPQHKKLSKLDEFHRSRVARENAYYWSDELTDYASQVLLSVVRGEVPMGPVKIHDYKIGNGKWSGTEQFKATGTKDAHRVFTKIEAVRIEVEQIAKANGK